MAPNAAAQGVLRFLMTIIIIAAGLYAFVSLLSWRQASHQVEGDAVPMLPDGPVPLGAAHFQGAPDAPVGLVVFSDFECDYCARFAMYSWPELKVRYADKGLLRLVFRHSPNEYIHSHAIRLARAADCAGEAGRFWDAHDLFFAGSRLADRLPDALGLDRLQFAECMSREADDRLDHDRREASLLNIKATPTFLVGHIKDDSLLASQVVVGAQPVETFIRAIERALAMPERVD